MHCCFSWFPGSVRRFRRREFSSTNETKSTGETSTRKYFLTVSASRASHINEVLIAGRLVAAGFVHFSRERNQFHREWLINDYTNWLKWLVKLVFKCTGCTKLHSYRTKSFLVEKNGGGSSLFIFTRGYYLFRKTKRRFSQASDTQKQKGRDFKSRKIVN